MTEKLKLKLKELPDKSGVYLMRDNTGKIIYIGKAVNLKSRVRSYFQKGFKDTKVEALIQKVADLDIIITNTEVDALLLENTLIKQHKPHYNILLKDDKLYPFLRIDTKEDYPKVEVIRRLKADNAKYFGPYMLGITTRDMLDLLHTAYPIRSCRHNLSKLPKTHRPCLNYHIKKCKAPCMGYIEKEEYKKVIDKVIEFLRGEDKSIKSILQQKMQAASDNLEYELAMEYKKRLEVLDKMVRSQIVALPKDYNLDVFGLAVGLGYLAITVINVRGGKLVSLNKYPYSVSLDNAEALSSFIYQYYTINPLIAEEIICSTNIKGELLEEALFAKTQKRVSVTHPQRGVKKQLADMADNNAMEYLTRSTLEISRKENMTMGAVTQLGNILDIPTPIRMECFDISNLNKTFKTASMAVFLEGEKAADHYRSFRIKTVEGQDDFASMKEVLLRRLARLKENKDISFKELPDLIIIDGGKGQITYAKEALLQSGYQDIPLIALAEREEIIIKENKEELELPKNSFALMLLQRIRDEAHRFAINYHRKLRESNATSSILESIEGIGAKTVKALFKHFKSLDAIRLATKEELLKVPRLGSKQADNIIKFFKTVEG